jgi:hypothetical protein
MGIPLVAAMPGAAVAHDKFDHPAPGDQPVTVPLTSAINSGGPDAEWEPVATIPTGNPHTDLEFFTQTVEGGSVETFASVGTLAVGANAGGQSIVQLTETDEEGVQTVDPSFFSSHPSATCISDYSRALGLQHDVEATPKGDTINNGSYLPQETADAQLIIDATDASGRCHDQGDLGLVAVPRGGLELVDVTTLTDPVEIGLTSHIGQSHTVNVDPKRPHIAYSVTSDSVSVSVDADDLDGDGDTEELIRENEDPEDTDRFDLDGFEMVDMSSCMNVNDRSTFAADAEVDVKREGCRPEVFRYRYPTLDMSLGHTNFSQIFGCHELEVYPDDRLTCAGGGALLVFDMSEVFNDNGTPDDFTDDSLNGTPLDCRVRESSTADPLFDTAAMITDCVEGVEQEDGTFKDLTIPAWLDDGAPSLDGVEHLGSIYHQGRGGPFPATEDIDFNHESEFTLSGKNLIATDERGGGVLQGAQCTAGNPIAITNGGVNAYQVDELRTGDNRPETPEEAFEAYARGTDGEKAIFRAPIRTGAEGTFCTSHVMQQIPGQNRIFMGWYRQGTQVIDYVELPDGVFEWVENQDAQEETEATEDDPAVRAQAETEQAGFFIPEQANEWVSHVFRSEDNGDGTFTYFGVAGDFGVRNAIDIYKVTMPAPADACTLAPDATVDDREEAREVHREAVDCVIHYNISKGTTATTYSPTIDVTREQMAGFIARTIDEAGGVLPAASGTEKFDDIGDSIHKDNINRLAQAGIIKGIGGGKFDPRAQITRQQMATFIVNAARFTTGEAYDAERSDHYGDVPPSNVHAENINAGFEAGLFQGTTAPTDEPNSGIYGLFTNVQRDQMASFLSNLFVQTIQP